MVQFTELIFNAFRKEDDHFVTNGTSPIHWGVIIQGLSQRLTDRRCVLAFKACSSSLERGKHWHFKIRHPLDKLHFAHHD